MCVCVNFCCYCCYCCDDIVLMHKLKQQNQNTITLLLCSFILFIFFNIVFNKLLLVFLFIELKKVVLSIVVGCLFVVLLTFVCFDLM